MRLPRTATRISAALALTGLLACDKGPTGPMTPTTTPPSQTTNLSTVRVEISGASDMAPGGTAQFAAAAFFSDGSTRDVTGEAVWISGDARVLSLSKSGLATAHQIGEASVRATFGGKESGQRGVLVLVAGTFKIGGYVEDGGVGIPGARVEITAGSAAGMVAVTQPRAPSGGSYTFLGVAGDTEFRVTKDGYEPLVRTVRVTENQQINFYLKPLVARSDLSGTYMFTITADCQGGLPSELRTQTYPAVLTQDGARLTATLSGANFLRDNDVTLNSFDGAIEPSRVWFYPRGFAFWDDPVDPSDSVGYGDVMVQLTSSTFLSIGGWATTTVSADGLSGALSGQIEVVERVGAGPKDWRSLGKCSSSSHRFVMTR